MELKISHPKPSDIYNKESFSNQPIPYIARINWRTNSAEIKLFRKCYFRVLYYSQKLDQSMNGLDFYEVKSSKLLLNVQTEVDISIFPNQEYFFKLVSTPKYGYVMTSNDYNKKQVSSQILNKYLEGYIVWWLDHQYNSMSRWTSFQPCCLTYCNPLFKRKPVVTAVKVFDGDGYFSMTKSEVSWKLDYLQYPSCISHYESGLYRPRRYIESFYYLLKRLNRFDTKFSIDNELVTCHENIKYVILVHGWNNRTFHTEHWTPNMCDSKKRPNSTVDETKSYTSWLFGWTTPFSDLPKIWKSLWNAITERTNI